MSLKKLTAFLLVGGVTAVGAAAVTNDAAAQNINPWQHCGIGSMIFPENGTASAISNIIWDSGTTAVTSATASPGTCESREIETAQFINGTYDVLAMETATGEGEHLDTLAGMAGCNTEVRGAVVAQLRGDLQATMSREDYLEMTADERAYEYYGSFWTAANATEGCAVG